MQAAQIASLIEAASRTPYGKGSETILNTSVGGCWQFDASKFKVGGSRWKETFGSLLDQVAEGLGSPRECIKAKPYKLLVIERVQEWDVGAFEVAHDSRYFGQPVDGGGCRDPCIFHGHG